MKRFWLAGICLVTLALIAQTPPGGGDVVTADAMNACISAAVVAEFGGSCDSELKA